MNIIDDKIIRNINKGRCFVFLGSGPSCEIGYPSWRRLAEDTYSYLKDKMHLEVDKDSYEKYLSMNKLPEIFQLFQESIGDRNKLVDIIKIVVEPKVKKNGNIYNTLANWPFACYLTTNFDNEIYNHLSKIGKNYPTLRNNREDFFAIRDGINSLIYKIHSDLDHVEEVVITSEDYRKFYIEDSKAYFRDKIRQIFEIFDVIIIGHSLTDPDINYILQVAKKTGSPINPIYMFLANATKAEEQEYFQKYNIQIIGYRDVDGSHMKLRRLLSTLDKFIISPSKEKITHNDLDQGQSKSEIASSLYLHRILQSSRVELGYPTLILSSLPKNDEVEIEYKDIIKAQPIILVVNSKNKEIILNELETLVNEKLVEKNNDKYRISLKGQEQVDECKNIREVEKRQAFEQFTGDLKNALPSISEDQLKNCVRLAEHCLSITFESRGLTIAKKIFSAQSASSNELSDIFKGISFTASQIDDIDLRLAFIDTMHGFIIKPNSPQSKYLTSLSQGFFLFHMIGLDPKLSNFKLDVFAKTFWIVDSNVLLPLIAKGSANNEYAIELINILIKSGANLYTTEKILQETMEHFSWAKNFILNNRIDSIEFLEAALLKGSYKQNLFLDGYIRSSVSGYISSFDEYFDFLFEEDADPFRKVVEEYSINVLDIQEIAGFDKKDWSDVETAKAIIQKSREDSGTYRSDLQVTAEAEIKIIITRLREKIYKLHDEFDFDRVYFISQSRILDFAFNDDKKIITWVPEAVYTYVSNLPGQKVDPEILHKCMLVDFYYAGVSFIDKESYTRFFGTTIDQAKASYQKEKENYIQSVEKINITDLDKKFDRIPDLEKPFFIRQMSWTILEDTRSRLDYVEKIAKEATEQVKVLETEKNRNWKIKEISIEKQEKARIRHLTDLKHQRKRKKQAKKRNKKKK